MKPPSACGCAAPVTGLRPTSQARWRPAICEALVEQGLLMAKGEKKGRTYIGSEALLAIRQKTREPRIPLAEIYKDQLTLPL